MRYRFTARQVEAGNGVVVLLINGGMAQRGCRESDLLRFPNPVVDEIAEAALLDKGYCLDAPDRIPAGACRGEPSLPPYAMAIQLQVAR
jgi:hypothetical protein